MLHAKSQFIPEPTRRFAVGDQVSIGNLENSVVVGVLLDGRAYMVESDNHERESRSSKRKPEDVPLRKSTEFLWTDLLPLATANNDRPSEFADDNIRFERRSQDIFGILSGKYNFGIDDRPSFQRPYVWDDLDKSRLIETIFDQGSVGLMVFNRLPYSNNGPMLEIVDGKQRLGALTDFYEDRLVVRGIRYSGLCRLDRSRFGSHVISTLQTQEADEKTLLRLFLRVNRAGRPVDESHIAEVRDRLALLEAATKD